MRPIEQLAEAFRKGTGQVELNSAFLSQAGASPPPGFDQQLAAAFGLEPPQGGLEVIYEPSAVSPVSEDSFEITGAHISFLGFAASNSSVTLRFEQSRGPLAAVIEVVLSGNWSWASTFVAMNAWPFSLFAYGHPTFAFATERRERYPWSGGQEVNLQPGQNFIAAVNPVAFGPTIELLENVEAPLSMTLNGPVSAIPRAQRADGKGSGVLPSPEMNLSADLLTGKVKLLEGYLEVGRPRIGLRVETVTETFDENGLPLLSADGEPTSEDLQTPRVYVGFDLAVGPPGREMEFEMLAPLLGAGLFSVSIAVAKTSKVQLTPAEAIKAVAGPTGASFMAGMPAPLQQFLEKIGLNGLSLSGSLTPPRLSSVGAELGTQPGQKIVLLPGSGETDTFAIDSFSVVWSMLEPLDSTKRINQVTVAANMVIWPQVFRKANGEEGGSFEIAIDETMRVEGSFNGKVTFSDLLEGVSGGALQLPQGVSAAFSDVDVVLDPSARTYLFGCTLDATLDFVKLDDKPLLSLDGVRFELGATRPAQSGATVYTGKIAGVVAVGPVALAVDVRYEGAAAVPVWKLSSRLAQPLLLGQLVDQFLDEYSLPPLIPESLKVETFSLQATMPTEKSPQAKPSYAVSGSLDWEIDELDAQVGAQLELRYDGTSFSGAAIGDLTLSSVEVEVGYAFDKKKPDVLWIAWEGLRGEYTSGPPKQVKLTAKGWTLGRLVEGLMRDIVSGFTLDPPWDFLNKISLDGLTIVIDLSGPKPTFSAEYAIDKIDLGFIVVEGVKFARGSDGKVLLALSGRTTIPSLEKSELFPSDGKPARDVTDMPPVPGGGTEKFELWLLALGQRVSLRGAESFESIAEAVEKMEKLPSSGGSGNPVDPTQQEAGQPYYDPTAGWLAALHFGVLKAGKDYTFECALVFADPDLYGLHLKLAGEKAKALKGLELDVLYKKVSDDVGVYQAEFTFPESVRQLDFGAFSVTLPKIGVQIYTNGDFLFDFGFPYKADFSRSFGMSAQIGPVPVVGALGFYFGRLSIGSQAGLPEPHRGTFSPAIVFGLGVTFGVGRYFQKGPLSAGLSLTVFGIVEGTIAAWHSPDTKELTEGGGGESPVQADYYFHLRGTFGITGKLYGSVDFVLVKAEVNVTVQLSAQITYESFKDIELQASASVSVSVSLKIDLGLFSIRIGFSFATTISADLTISTGAGTPPWQLQPLMVREMPALPAAVVTAGPKFKRVVNATHPATIALRPVPQFTVVPGGTPNPADLTGAFVFLLAIDAPAADEPDTDATSFDHLCEVLLPWVVDAFVNPSGEEVDLAAVGASSVSRLQLEEIVAGLTGGGDSAISEEEVEKYLLSQACSVEIAEADKEEGGAIFPPFGGLSLTIPDPKASGGTKEVKFDAYTTITEEYRKRLAELLRELAARVEEESGGRRQEHEGALGTEPEPLGRFLFEDWFGIVAQQLAQAGADAMTDYAYPLQGGDSIGSIVAWAQGRGNTHLGPMDVATPNAAAPLAGNVPLEAQGLTYVVQAGDSLGSIAARYSDSSSQPRWQTSPEQLILENQARRGLIAAGAKIELGGAGYTTRSGDSFAIVAEELGTTVPALAQQTSLRSRTDLLAPAQAIALPTISYRTASDAPDTLAAIAARFDLGLEQLVEANLGAAGLFGGETIRIANLDRLLVEDVWAALRRDRQPAQVAGIVSRFALHGVRLPAKEPAGLNLPGDFLYPSGEDDYGLYQLTGQQFPTPKFTEGEAPSYPITLARDADLAWLRFPGAPGTATMPLDLDAQAQRLQWVLDWARKNGFDPRATVAAQAEVAVSPQRYATRSATPWSTSDTARLETIASPPGAAASSGPAPQVQPILWELPETVQRDAGDRIAQLSAHGFQPHEIAPYLPAVRPALGTTDPATGQARFSPVADFATATRIQFQVKRLAQEDDLAPQRPDANHVVPPGNGNSGSPSPPLAPYCYEVVAPNPADAVLLERLLLALGDHEPPTVSDCFLLFENAPGTPGLTSRGNGEFVAFMTQTNLATETAPETAREIALDVEEGLRRGFLNSDEEIVELLWELATVRGGGTYLYYQLPDEGAGLPATVFNADGIATLTLVIAYGRDSSLGDAARVTGAVNSFFTTAPVDLGRAAMTLESRPAPAAAEPPAGVDTLGEIADLYGVEPGGLGTLNENHDLAAVGVPILGATYQLSAADVAAGAYAAVASRFSAGAEKSLSAAEVEKFNPGIPPLAGRTLRVPPVTCVVGAPNAPGKTLKQLSDYFGLPVEALAAALGDVAAFPAGTPLRVDSQQHEAQSHLGTGNAGIAVERPRPEEPQRLGSKPSQEEKDAYASSYMGTLFTLLGVGVEGSSFFSASRPSLPSAPRKPLSPEEASAYRHPEERVAALRADAEASEPLLYEQTIGIGTVARLNPCDESDPSGSENPYKGIGSVLELGLDWLDLFGNRAALAPSVGPAERIAPVPVDYSDRLVGLSQWPNVNSAYTYSGTGGAPELVLNLTLEGKAYDDPEKGPRQARVDARTFAAAHWQLAQDYDAANVPGLSGRAVSMTIVNSLLAAPEVPLGDQQAAQVRGFVTACLEYLDTRAQGGSSDAPAATVKVPLPGSLRPDSVIPLEVALRLDRQPLLTAPALRARTGGAGDSTPVMPEGSSKGAASLKPFAETFEGVFTEKDWGLRVGTSAALPGDSAATRDTTVWAVRTAREKGGPGVGFSIEGDPSFYAPLPAARELANAEAEIGRYTTGKAFPDGMETRAFHGADLNAWAQTALAAIDGFLTPTYTAPAFLVDQLSGGKDPAKEGWLAKILEHKEAIAAAIAKTTRPILAGSATDSESVEAAAKKIEQALLDRLSNAFTLTAATVLDVSGAHYGDPLPPLGRPPRLLGQPLGVPQSDPEGEGAERNFSLSSGKVPLTSQAEGSSRLAFLFESRDAGAAAHVPLDVFYAATHLEHDITEVPGIKGYQQSAWIAFVTGPLQPQTGPEPLQIDFPVVLRALPKPPTAVAQTATKADPEPTSPTELARWGYGFSYLYQSAAQDTVTATVEWNRPQLEGFGHDAAEAELFRALAQFVTAWPAVEADLEAFLRPLDAKATSLPPGAAPALQALESIASTLATAYKRWAEEAAAEPLGGPEHLLYEFDLELEEAKDGSARIDVVKGKEHPPPPSATAPRVKLASYEEVPVETPPEGVWASWAYRDAKGKPLSYGKALGISERTVEFEDLNALAFQNACAALQVVRNQELVRGEKTNEEFVFTTPKVSFAQPVVPLLDYEYFPLAPPGTEAPLRSHLDKFFSELLSEIGDLEVKLKVQSAYAYRLAPDLDESPETVLPIGLLPPTPTTTATPAFLGPLADAVSTWVAGMADDDHRSRLTFDLELFSGSAAAQQMPLLVIRDLYLPRSQLK